MSRLFGRCDHFGSHRTQSVRLYQAYSRTLQLNPFSITSVKIFSVQKLFPSTRRILSRSWRSKFILLPGKCSSKIVTILFAWTAPFTFVLKTSIIVGKSHLTVL